MENHNSNPLFYYMDGLEKKGPYSVNELKTRDLSSDTLVYSGGMSSWALISEIPELSDRIFDSSEKSGVNEFSQNLKNNLNKFSEPLTERKIRVPSTIFLVIGILLALALSYYIALSQKDGDLQHIQFNIDNVLHGQDEVCDYQHFGVQGQLKRADSLTPFDNEGKRLVEYYSCTNGGFTVLTLTRKDNGYELVTSTSENMGYKIPAARYTPSKDYGYGVTAPGFSTPTYRQPVQIAYDQAMKYLSSEKENKSYDPGSYDKIKSFGEIESTFYDIENIDPTKASEGATNFKSWKGSGFAYVFNSEWVVYYSTEGVHYEIVEKKNAFMIRFVIYSLVGCSLSIILYLLIRYRRKIAIG